MIWGAWMEWRASLRIALGAIVLIASSGYAVAGEKLELTHTVYLGGLYLGNVKTDIVQADNKYQIESKAQTNGTWKWLFSWIAEGRSSGVIKNAKILPQSHGHKSAWNDKKRGAVIEYSPSGQVDFKLVGKGNDNLKKYTPLDLSSIHMSLDPMSLVLAASEQMQEDGQCSGEYSVFDGRRRYDILLSSVSDQLFGSSDYSVFEGKAYGCKIKVVKKGGFRRESNYDFPADKDLVLWAGTPIDGGMIVPVRMHVETEFGAMEMHLARYSQGDTRLASKNAD